MAEPVTSSNNIPKQTDSLKTKDSNKPLLTSTGVKPTTSASGSKSSGNTKNNRITRPPRSNQKNKVKDHPTKVKSSSKKTNSVSEPINNALVKHSVRKAKFESMCAICNKCLFDANHDMCLVDFVNDVNVRLKSKSKRNKKEKAWKPTCKVFTDVGYKWKPTGRFFTIVGNSCPLTKITPKEIMHLKETTPKSVETPKPNIKVYSRRPKQLKSVGSSKKAKIVESKIANNSEPTHLWGSNATDVPSSSSFVSDREPLSAHELCSRDINLYNISLDDMPKTSPICLLSKASKIKSWLWHRRLSHLNFGTLNKLAKDGLARAPDAIIKCIKNIQLRLNATVRNVRTDNGTEFVNQTLRDFYENVNISHQTFVARTP
ncbi:retrovirus-related pol polyprotein from transposon TNT 1-94 [Tanacetum coccineum]